MLVQRFFCFGLSPHRLVFKGQVKKDKGQNKRALGLVLTIGQH
jgi:hypothetical protein